MRDQWIKFGAGFLLVYSITDRPTFEAILGLHQDILRVKDRSYVPCVVVSNKVSCSTSFPFAVVILALLGRLGILRQQTDISAIWAGYGQCISAKGGI